MRVAGRWPADTTVSGAVDVTRRRLDRQRIAARSLTMPLEISAAVLTTIRTSEAWRSAGIRISGPATETAATHAPRLSKIGAAMETTPGAASSVLIAYPALRTSANA